MTHRRKKIPKKKEPNYKVELRRLTDHVQDHLSTLDRLMKEPPSYERGRAIARLCNFLDMQNSSIRHFTLGLPLPGYNPPKPLKSARKRKTPRKARK